MPNANDIVSGTSWLVDAYSSYWSLWAGFLVSLLMWVLVSTFEALVVVLPGRRRD